MNSVKQVISLGLEVIRSHFVFLFVLFLLTTAFTSFTDQIRTLLMDGYGFSILNFVVFEIGTQSVLLVLQLIWILALGYMIMGPEPLAPFHRVYKFAVENLNQALIENIRSYAGILWRVPFLILPGLLKLIEWIYVPLIVAFDATYLRGETDALKRSSELSKEFKLKLFQALFFGFILPSLLQLILIEPFSNDWSSVTSWLLRALSFFIEIFRTVYFILVFKWVLLQSQIQANSVHASGNEDSDSNLRSV